MGLLSLVNRASLNQRAVGSTPTRPTKTINYSQILLLDSVNLVPGFGAKFFRLRVEHIYKLLFATGEPLRTSVWISPHSLSSYDAL